MKRELTCIRCPIGCRIAAEKIGDEWKIEGNGCPRGKAYAISESTAPVRTLTTTFSVRGGACERVPVKTAEPVPKDEAIPILRETKSVAVEAPVSIGDEVARVRGYSFVATASVGKRD